MAALFLAAVALWLIVSRSPPPLKASLAFAVAPTRTNDPFCRSYSVVISNSSKFYVLYPISGGLKEPMVYIKYITPAGWQESYGTSVGKGDGLMRPHEVKRTNIEIPEGAAGFKVGLYITTLTWRGRLAWQTVEGRPQRALAPIGRFFMQKDTRTRSVTEWSEQYTPGDLRN